MNFEKTANNTFTIARGAKPTPGFVIAKKILPNRTKPEWAVSCGGWMFALDRKNPASCVRDAGGETGMIYSASAHVIETATGGSFTTIAAAEKNAPLLVFVDLNIRGGHETVRVMGREIRPHYGVSGGVLLGSDRRQYLIEVREGEAFTIFHPDGTVRAFVVKEGALIEVDLQMEEMLEIRLREAEFRINMLDNERDVRGCLAGVVDLFLLTTLEKRVGFGQVMRIRLIDWLKTTWQSSTLNLVYSKVMATLHSVDPALVDVFRASHERDLRPKATVVQLDDHRPDGAVGQALVKARRVRDTKREQRRQERDAACRARSVNKGKGGGGKQQKQNKKGR